MIPNDKPCLAKISKQGDSLFVKIPVKKMHIFGKGDLVEVKLLEKAKPTEKTLKQIAADIVQNPRGAKLKGNIEGISAELILAKMINALPKEKAEKIVFESLK